MRLRHSLDEKKGRIIDGVFFLILLVSSTFLFTENSRLKEIIENQRAIINAIGENNIFSPNWRENMRLSPPTIL